MRARSCKTSEKSNISLGQDAGVAVVTEQDQGERLFGEFAGSNVTLADPAVGLLLQPVDNNIKGFVWRDIYIFRGTAQ